MASSRRTGTNENISTYGAAGHGRDYTSVITWEADTDYDLVSATTSEVLECYADDPSFADYIGLGGATTNSSYFRIVRPASGESHDGTPNTGVKFTYTADNHGVIINENYSQVQDIIHTSTINSSNNRSSFYIGSSADYAAFVGCMAVDSSNAGSGGMAGIYVYATSDTYNYVINCLVHNVDNRAFWAGGAIYGYVYFYNCTSVANGAYGFYSEKAAAKCIVKNCASSDNSIGDWTGDMTKTTCTAEGANPTYVDAPNDDFRLDSTDVVCINNGTDLSADGTYAFDDDIEFESRPYGASWDIGFDECSTIPTASNQPLISIMT